ncbi:cupin domain-containing protein [Citromicrobium bathyomarinum]|uniref:cupin domain-containing protein n=1 Tax=Citromicrobium bathyomarinum TaxID=72174 RepID=UPI003159A99E
MAEPRKLSENPIHLGLGATAEAQPPFTGMDWYEKYGRRSAADGAEGRLVSMHSFSESWDSWEMHPSGHEVVVCTAGEITLIQEYPDGRIEKLTLGPGDYAVNDPGVWHTPDVAGQATALFITAGEGTQHRSR